MPDSVFLTLLRGLESDALADGSSSTFHSLADTVRPLLNPVTGDWDLQALGRVLRWWLGARGFEFPAPPRRPTGPQPVLRTERPGAEFPEPEGALCGACGTGIYRFSEEKEWRHQDGSADADHVPQPAGTGA